MLTLDDLEIARRIRYSYNCIYLYIFEMVFLKRHIFFFENVSLLKDLEYLEGQKTDW